MKKKAGLLSLLLTLSPIVSEAKTLGQLLSQSDRGAGQKLEKKKAAIPEAGKMRSEKSHFGESPAVNLSKVKPPKSSKFYEDVGGDQAQYEKVLDEQINEAFKLTKKMSKNSGRGELWLRLAELYVEKAGLIDFRVQGEYDKALKAFQDGSRKHKPKLNLSSAREYNRKAIQLYEWFVRDFPNDPKLDQAYFFLGYNYFELGQQKKGSHYYTLLTKKFPKSQYVTETHFALAEYYFEGEKWKLALDEYQHVLKKKSPRLYFFSLFKVAWCYYRLGYPDKALRTAEILLQQNKKAARDDSGKAVNRERVESEALRDLVLFYAEAGSANKAVDYFKGYAGNNSSKYLEMLAYAYGNKGQRQQAREIFNYLISLDPIGAKAFEYKYQIVQQFSTSNKVDDFKQELYSWITEFSPKGRWHSANKDNKDLIENSDRLREATLKNWTLQHHQTAQNARTKFSRQVALDGYRLFFAEFPHSPAAPDMHFYYAELLYDVGQFDQATDQYKWMVENAPNSKFYSQAAENIVLASEKDVPSDKEIQKRIGKQTDPVPFDPATAKFVESSSWYLSNFPNAAKAVDMKFRIARLHYLFNQYDKAIPMFKEIVQTYPKTKFAEYSSNLLLDSYNLNKDFAGLEKASGDLLAMPAIAQSGAGQEIRSVMEKASFKKAQDLEEKKDYLASAGQFADFAKSNPTSTLAAAALFNAAINFERAGKGSSAIALHAQLLANRQKEGEKLREKSIQILPKLYQDAGMLEQAAKAYQQAADQAKNDREAAGLLFNAALIQQLLGQNSQAVKGFERYMEVSANKDKAEARFRLAEILRDRNSYSQAMQYYMEYVESPNTDLDKVLESSYQVYELSKNRKPKITEEWKRKTIRIASKTASGKSYLAKFKLADASQTYSEMKGVRLVGDPKRQQKAVQEKLALMNKLTQQLSEVVKQDSTDEIVASLYLLGEANLHLAHALVGAPIPSGLNAEETKEYKAGVEKIAAPFVAKAKESFAGAVSRGIELHSYGDGYHGARRELMNLDSDSMKGQDGIPLSYSVELAVGGEPISGEPTELFSKATQTLSENPKDVGSLNALAWYHKQIKQPLASKYFYDRALELGESSEIRNNLALLLFASGNKSAGFVNLRKAFEQNTKNRYIAANLGCAYSMELDHLKAQIPLESAYQNGARQVQVLNDYALALTANDKQDLAQSRYKEAYAADSFNKELIYNYASFLVRQAKKSKDGLEMINRLKFLGAGPEMREAINKLEIEAKAVK